MSSTLFCCELSIIVSASDLDDVNQSAFEFITAAFLGIFSSLVITNGITPDGLSNAFSICGKINGGLLKRVCIYCLKMFDVNISG